MSTDLRTIERAEDAASHEERRRNAGPAPQLQWLDIDHLVVDPAYQRPITRAGRANIGKIAGEFRWSRFSPVIVSPVEGGRYAIIDGQHRVTAAAGIGIEAVPCQIVLATQGEQAESFTAINGATTRVTALALHRAAVAAGEPSAIAVAHVAARAGVKILAYPVATLDQELGQTMAVGAIAGVIARHGADVAVLALRCIVETPRNNVRGGVLASIVTAVGTVVRELRAERRSEADILALFDSVLLIREMDKAAMNRQPGVPIHAALAERLRGAIRSKGGC
ncbi:DUF6551 family protein [Ancylobacter pratisalsi]|uniref:ParB N-terminal domain-containing protein n=1 Tax=Ancylobacter pratisalsi TaxID=1745854 RepID=A0A6P1YRU0_9HYPH|nr:DUF6551 family protein [Ancylobacter pratisalsi]QIB34773.1 ParB N-terminal domain-containing protein [Ancylobacter pratisalsi]